MRSFLRKFQRETQLDVYVQDAFRRNLVWAEFSHTTGRLIFWYGQPEGYGVRLPMQKRNFAVRMKICPSEIAGELSV
jgi:hypothetical protein